MRYNKGGDKSKSNNLSKDQIIEALFKLLDDIDTASDMLKPEKTDFYNYVMRKAQERFHYIYYDGYKIERIKYKEEEDEL